MLINLVFCLPLSHIGKISRKDGGSFGKEDVKPLLDAVRLFLSFAYGDWCSPILVYGSTTSEVMSWEYYRNYDASSRVQTRGWVDVRHGNWLVEAFPGFMSLWEREIWREPLELAVSWLVESSKQSGGIEGAIAFGQIPLELFGSLILVEESKALTEKQYDKLIPASAKIGKLLCHCGIHPCVPPSQVTLQNVVRNYPEFSTAPQLITIVRNTIIHPSQKKRRTLQEWAAKCDLEVSEILWETRSIFNWYTTLVLLSCMKYSGCYVNRLSPQRLDSPSTKVPWSKNP